MHVLLLILVLSPYTLASVTVQYPLEAQLPLIARVNIPYNWTISKNTFVSSHNASLDYVALSLPGWLAFDRTTLSFHGTPSSADEGSKTIKLIANDSEAEDGACSSSFSLLVASTPAPKVMHSVGEQFQLPNPSLSSVFLVSDHSALKSTIPALRIPPKWSFSIGFQYDTFASNDSTDVFYGALQTDGSPLPDWIEFNPNSITFNGVTPSTVDVKQPRSLALALHASDQEGYSAASLPFTIFVAEHELSLATSSLPTINVTASSDFSVSLNSPVDFSGVLLDGHPIQPSDIVTLQVDTSYYGEWLNYDTDSRTLSGNPPDDLDKEAPVLPVTIATTVNQTIETNVSIAVVPSYFSSPSLQPVLVQAGQSINFNLVQYFSNLTGVDRGDVSLSAAFDPDNSTQFLSFDPNAATVGGTVPANFTAYSHITITFTAYSHVTHSTSHTSLPISLTASDYAHSHNKTPSNLSTATKAKLLLGLKIAFGVIGGVVLLGLCLAGLRRCARVPDTAVEGEEGTYAWSEEDKKWYGIGIEVDGETVGPELRRVRTRMDDEQSTPGSLRQVASPGVMRKSEFLSKVRSTARQVSDTVKAFGSTNKNRRRPVIGKPTLIMTEDGRRANMNDLRLVKTSTSDDPFDDANAPSNHYAPSALSGWTGASASIPGSPSSSTGGRSIPRRRPDFAPPSGNEKHSPSTVLLATPPQTYTSKTHAYAQGAPLARSSSVDSDDSNDSAKTHATEAVVQRAERARSIRSGHSASVVSFQAQSHVEHHGPSSNGPARPRLVPFTSAARVPVPKMPSTTFDSVQDRSVAGNIQGKTKRVTSQMAKVFRSVSTEKRFSQAEGAPGDDLSVGIEYVRALGGGNDEASSHSTSNLNVSFDQHLHFSSPCFRFSFSVFLCRRVF